MYRFLILTITLLLFSFINAAPTLKYSTRCSVDECTLAQANNQTNQSCSDTTVCYKLDTTRNTTICAPQIVCSMFEACINNSRTCASTSSVCVTNTCCDRPVCIPLALTQMCTRYTTSSSAVWSQRLCQNATWDSNPVTVTPNSYYYSGQYISVNDIAIDGQDNLLLFDYSGQRILKVNAYNNTNYTIMAGFVSNSSSYGQFMSLDNNGSVLVTQSFYSTVNYQTYYQIVKYRLDGTNSSGVVVYGPVTCGQGLSELCYPSGFVVDSSGSIYYSDAQNHRILKIQQFATMATVVAGTTGVSGSALNQLNSPGVIALDSSQNLYVSDYGNNRVLKFTQGSTTGIALFTTSMYQGVSGIAVHSSGSVFALTNGNLIRWMPEINGYIVLGSVSSYGTRRICLDRSANIFTQYTSGSYVQKYTLLSNYC